MSKTNKIIIIAAILLFGLLLYLGNTEGCTTDTECECIECLDGLTIPPLER